MNSSVELARRIRRHALQMVARANSSHIGGALSCADILAVLYHEIMRISPQNSRDPHRDRLLISKGHIASIVYAVLAERGFFPLDRLATFCRDGSSLIGHVEHHVPGVEASFGALGHGLAVGCGMALSAKRSAASWRTFVISSDGELDEGSNWEAIHFAGHHQLSNLILIVDANGLQGLGSTESVVNLEPLSDKFQAFGWSVTETNGHDHESLKAALGQTPWHAQKPNVLIARTIKGKGVEFMENQIPWHYKAPNDAQLKEALAEIDRS